MSRDGERPLRSALPTRRRDVRTDDLAHDQRSSPPVRGGGLWRLFAALRHENYRYYWFGQMISVIGTWMQTVSQPWLVLLLGGSPFQLGLVLACQFAPALVLAPISGVMADRLDKRRVIMLAQSLAMVEASLLFTLTILGVVEIWHVMILASVMGISQAIEGPFRQSFAAELVPREDLMNAIALNSASFNLARVLGPAIAGVILAAFGPAANFGLNALSTLAVLFGLSRINTANIRRLERAASTVSIRNSLAEGVRYAARTPLVLWPLVMLAGVSTFAMNFQILLPVLARSDLGLGAAGYGGLFAAMGAGCLLGSLSLAFAGSNRPLVGLILGGGLAFLAFETALGFVREPWIAYVLVFFVGLASMLMLNTINATIQQNVSHDLRGRVMSLYVFVLSGSTPFGGIFAGFVTEHWGVSTAFLLGAGISAVFVALVAWHLVIRGKGWTTGRAPRKDLVIEAAETIVDGRTANP